MEILNWLDDHARYALSVTAHARVTGAIVLATFRKACATHGIPASTLTDNGMVFTTRLSGGKGGRNHLENELRRLGVTQINSTPNHPTTCGKVERFHQTLKKWLTSQPRAATIAELQTQLDTFVEIYNHHRPHRATAPSGHPRHRLHRPAQSRPRQTAPTPTTESATTASTNSENSPCATPAASTTSASAEPTPAPASSCSSRISTSESSTPPPANSSAS